MCLFVFVCVCEWSFIFFLFVFVFCLFCFLCVIFCISNTIDSRNAKLDDMYFPFLCKMYQFLFNFGIFCHCYPFQEQNESFYVMQYFNFRKKVFEIDLNQQFTFQLKQFDYFSTEFGGGTLLSIYLIYCGR